MGDQEGKKEVPSSHTEDTFLRIGVSTAGGLAVGSTLGSLFGPTGVGVGAAVGGAIGFGASVTDTIKSKS